MSTRRVLFAVCVVLASRELSATVQVNHVDNLKSTLSRVAIFPAACPSNIDCLGFENAIARQLAQRNVPLVPAGVVRQIMFDSDLNEITDELRQKLVKQFGVNAFVIAAVGDARRESTGSVGTGTATANPFINSVWAMFGSANIERSSGNVQIAIVRADNGKALMRGSGYGESQLRSLPSVLERIASEIFEQGFFVPIDR